MLILPQSYTKSNHRTKSLSFPFRTTCDWKYCCPHVINYLTMHHLVIEMCTDCLFLLQYGMLWDMEGVHCRVCATGFLFVRADGPMELITPVAYYTKGWFQWAHMEWLVVLPHGIHFVLIAVLWRQHHNIASQMMISSATWHWFPSANGIWRQAMWHVVRSLMA